jgi:hypothetical protein
MNALNPFTILSCGVKPNLVSRYDKKVGKVGEVGKSNLIKS